MTVFGGYAALAIDAIANPATLKRRAPGAYLEGLWTKGAETQTPIRAAIQAPSERDLRELPEGERTEGTVAIWSRSELRVADEDTGTEADRIIGAGGDTYKIVRVSDRTEAGFYRAIGRLEHDRGRSVQGAP